MFAPICAFMFAPSVPRASVEEAEPPQRSAAIPPQRLVIADP